MENKTPSVNNILQLVYLAIIGGLLSMALIFIIITYDQLIANTNKFNLSNEIQIYLSINILVLFSGYGVGSFIEKNILQKGNTDNNFKTAQIIKLALAEIPCIISLLFYYMHLNLIFLGVFLLGLLVLISLKPKKINNSNNIIG